MSDITQNTDDRARWIALYVLCAGFMMIVIDVTIINVALPLIQTDLDFSPSGLAWVVNAYLIAFAGFLLLAGRFGDLIGRRSVFLTGLAVFSTASVFCGLAQNETWLITARFIQGIGGAMTSAVALGMIVTMFPEPREQAKAIGVFAFVASAGGAIGLVLGGVITQSISWHWSFFVNAPVGLATAYLSTKYVKRDEGIGFEKGADALGAVLITSTLMLAVYTIVSPAAERGWTDGRTLTLGLVSVLLLGAFIIREATAAHPLMSLSIFNNRNVVGANLLQVFGAAGMFGISFMGALYVQRILDYDALQTGLAFLPLTVCMGILSVKFSEPLTTRFGQKPVMLVGFVFITAALLWFAQAPVDGNYLANVFPVTTLMGLGAGLAFPPIMAYAMSGVHAEEAGLASGLMNTTAQVGGALGLAIFATLAASRTTSQLADGAVEKAALNSGYHLAYYIAAGAVAVAFVLTAVMLRKPEPMKMPEGMDSAEAPKPVAVH